MFDERHMRRLRKLQRRVIANGLASNGVEGSVSMGFDLFANLNGERLKPVFSVIVIGQGLGRTGDCYASYGDTFESAMSKAESRVGQHIFSRGIDEHSDNGDRAEDDREYDDWAVANSMEEYARKYGSHDFEQRLAEVRLAIARKSHVTEVA